MPTVTAPTPPAAPADPLAATVHNPDPTKVDPNVKPKKKLSPKNQRILICSFEAIVLGLVAAFILIPEGLKVYGALQDYTAETKLLSDLRAKQRTIEQAQSVYLPLADDLPLINEAMSDFSNFPYVVLILEKLATEVIEESLETGNTNGMVLTRINIAALPNDRPPSEPLDNTISRQRQEVALTIGINGDFAAVRNYIIKLRSLRHNFFIDRLSFSAPNNDRPFLDANISLHYYYFLE